MGRYRSRKILKHPIMKFTRAEVLSFERDLDTNVVIHPTDVRRLVNLVKNLFEIAQDKKTEGEEVWDGEIIFERLAWYREELANAEEEIKEKDKEIEELSALI